ncbi:l-type lectin-domain containing receptor kinase vii.1 [Nicotiana attenuata]|uniref:L-type lectin-domain containing receptor kinase vii.1 n=1 Tax=Nicotiana attenuata TaxID=49451 RepID=A0A314KMR9_NICAT|nr:l-type lectin-domain containing receptor kinase vii.1 [Nicotiana attenuata]
MHARIGDFGLARMHDHGQAANETRVVGTVGYLAPEFAKTGRASTQTDVFSYGVLILELMCGRRPIEEGKPPLVDWLWELMKQGELSNAFDNQLRSNQGFNEEEALRVLQLGMICARQDPKARPTMRQVVKFFERNCEVAESVAVDMDFYLLESMRPNTMLPNYCSSRSISWTNSLVEGR